MTSDSPQSVACEGAASVVLVPEYPADAAPFVTQMTAMEPSYVECALAAEQIPLLFWLCDLTRPRLFIDLGAADASSYFALCQAAHKLSLEHESVLAPFSLGRSNHIDACELGRWVDVQNRLYAESSRIVDDDLDSLLSTLSDGCADIILLHVRDVSAEALRGLKRDVLAKISEGGVLIVVGLKDDRSALFNELAELGVSYRWGLGTGVGVVVPGGGNPLLLRHLDRLKREPHVGEAAEFFFQRLGAAARLKAEMSTSKEYESALRTTEHELSKAREDAHLYCARLVGRDAEILDLRAQLDWHRNEVGGLREMRFVLEERTKNLQKLVEKSDAELQSLREANNRAESKLREERERATKALGERGRMRKKVSDAQAQLAEMQRSTTEQQRVVERLHNEVQGLYQSRSWRVTAPIRRVMTLVRRQQR